MRISVKVTPRAVRDEVLISGDEYNVRVRAAPHEGKANESVIRLLAAHFKVARSDVLIVTGASGRKKIIEIRTKKSGL